MPPDEYTNYDKWFGRLDTIMLDFNGESPYCVDLDFYEMYERGLTPEEALDETRDEMLRLWE